VDAHVAVPACTVVEPGSLVMIMGTSICHMLLGRKKQMVDGMCGTVEDGIVPGFWGYEAGQSAVGDIFAWFFEHGVPDYIHREARARKLPFETVLEERAKALRPGQSGLVALDWWNGNRSILSGGALAAGRARGGYDSIFEAAEHMARVEKRAYRPRPENREVYNRSFAEYRTLHDYFGRGANDVMKRLKALQHKQVSE